MKTKIKVLLISLTTLFTMAFGGIGVASAAPATVHPQSLPAGCSTWYSNGRAYGSCGSPYVGHYMKLTARCGGVFFGTVSSSWTKIGWATVVWVECAFGAISNASISIS